jgi:hypothetical protein
VAPWTCLKGSLVVASTLGRIETNWVPLPVHEDSATKAFFMVSIRCEVGDGTSTLFWSDPWLQGRYIEDLAPDLVAVVQQRRRSVASALDDHRWLQDIQGPLTVPILAQYLQVRPMLDAVVLTLRSPDRVTWRWSASGQYSTHSAYHVMFLSQCSMLGAKELWRVKAPLHGVVGATGPLLDRGAASPARAAR